MCTTAVRCMRYACKIMGNCTAQVQIDPLQFFPSGCFFHAHLLVFPDSPFNKVDRQFQRVPSLLLGPGLF